MTTEDSALQIFISHRHTDKAIADIFCECFEDWSNGDIQVYQSSSAEHGSKIGEDLDDAIAEAIASANIVLLIYSDAPGDMDWCMYEAGLAQDPTSPSTKVAVFHTTPEPPDPLAGLLAVRLDSESVRQLAFGFHHKPDFFPGLGKAFAPRVDEEKIIERADELYGRLRKKSPEKALNLAVYDHLHIGLDYSHVDAIKACDAEKGEAAAYELAESLFIEKGKIVAHKGEPFKHFKSDELMPDMSLGGLLHRWTVNTPDAASMPWAKELCATMARAMLNYPEQIVSCPFRSLKFDREIWVLPVLGTYRTRPERGIQIFEVIFCPVDAAVAEKMIAPEG